MNLYAIKNFKLKGYQAFYTKCNGCNYINGVRF